MRISANDLTPPVFALKLPRPRWTSGPLASRTLKKTASRFAIAGVTALALLTPLWFLHVKTADPRLTRLAELHADLAVAKRIDARWDARVLYQGAPVATRPTEAEDLARVRRSLEKAAAEAKSRALRVFVSELTTAFGEKAQLLPRFERAAVDSRHALAAITRAESALGASSAAGAAGPRDRLLAAENLALRVIAAAHQYHDAPTAAHRAALERHAAGLARTHSLPRTVQASFSTLEADVQRLLLLKPVEQILNQGVEAIQTAPRLDELSDIYERELRDAVADRRGYRVGLIAYTLALAALIAYLATRTLLRKM